MLQRKELVLMFGLTSKPPVAVDATDRPDDLCMTTGRTVPFADARRFRPNGRNVGEADGGLDGYGISTRRRHDLAKVFIGA